MKLFIYGQRVNEIKRKRLDFQASGCQIYSEMLELRAFHMGNICGVLYNVLLPRNSLMPLVKMLGHQPAWCATSSMGMLLQGTNAICSQATDVDCLTHVISSCLETEQ